MALSRRNHLTLMRTAGDSGSIALNHVDIG